MFLVITSRPSLSASLSPFRCAKSTSAWMRGGPPSSCPLRGRWGILLPRRPTWRTADAASAYDGLSDVRHGLPRRLDAAPPGAPPLPRLEVGAVRLVLLFSQGRLLRRHCPGDP